MCINAGEKKRHYSSLFSRANNMYKHCYSGAAVADLPVEWYVAVHRMRSAPSAVEDVCVIITRESKR